MESDEILMAVKTLVIEVLTENQSQTPLKFGAGHDK